MSSHMGAGGELDEAALATTVDATEGLEQDIEQLLQSVAGMKGPGGPAEMPHYCRSI